MKLEPYLISFTKINSKWIKGLYVRFETIKLLEEDKGGNLLNTGLQNDFLRMTPKS